MSVCLLNIWDDFSAKFNRPEDPIIAQVGNLTIRRSELLGSYRALPAAAQAKLALPDAKKDLLQRLIHNKMLVYMGRQQGFERNGLFRRTIETNTQGLLSNWYMNRLRQRDLAVTDSEVRRYFNEHPAEYNSQIQFFATQIVFESLADAKKAQALLKKRQRSFEALARTYSIRTSTAPWAAVKLSSLIKGKMNPSFQKLLLSLRVGQVSDIYLAPKAHYYRLVRKDGQTIPSHITFDQAKEQIRVRLEEEKLRRWYQQTASTIKIQIDANALSSVQLTALLTPTTGPLLQSGR